MVLSENGVSPNLMVDHDFLYWNDQKMNRSSSQPQSWVKKRSTTVYPNHQFHPKIHQIPVNPPFVMGKFTPEFPHHKHLPTSASNICDIASTSSLGWVAPSHAEFRRVFCMWICLDIEIRLICIQHTTYTVECTIYNIQCVDIYI